MASGASSRSTDNGSSEPPPQTPPPWRVEGAPPAENDTATPPPKPPNPMRRPRWWLILLAAFALNWLIASLLVPSNELATINYTRFRAEVDAGNVKTINAKGDTIQGELNTPIEIDGTEITDFTTERPSFADDDLYQALTSKGTEVSAKPIVTEQPLWVILLANFGPTLLLVGLLVFATRAMRGGMGAGIGGIGRSKAVRVDETEGAKRTTFEDVAGIDEVEEQVVEIVDFLRHPDKYRRVGAQLPRGVLLSGPPGTGKTLLARALAGEAGVPFFSASASEFIEMIVGVGASRVRDLFEQAKKVAPAIIFIDELDAIGRARGGGASLGGVDEREQTLNQILTEMDGFTGAEGVIVVAATNRPDVLDPALLRPGRFDRRIVVNPPDINGREAILAVHTRGVPLAPDVSLATLAAATPGMVGADIKNLVNEAALLAASQGETEISFADFTNALEKILLGAERRITLSREERERTAFHESGHALLGMLIAGADPVRKVSIIPRGQALGVTFQAPSADRYGYDEAYLRGRITGALGGRAAEEVVYGNVTTGAESDLEQVTAIARQMVGRWGMSEAIGPITVLPGGSQGDSWYPGDARQPSETTRELVDAETRRLVDECYDEARRLLREHRPQLDALATALLERETLDELDAYAAAGVDHPSVEPLP